MKRSFVVLGVVLGLAGLTAACGRGAATHDPPAAGAASAAAAVHVTAAQAVGTDPGHAGDGTQLVAAPGRALAAFAEGCFWGSENTFRHVSGVTATAVGFTGGHTKSPSYEDVCTHTTGHAETVLVEFDPAQVSYAQLLDVFWRSHDPTTKDRQGPDVGDQYRSAIFTFSSEQVAQAKTSMEEAQKRFKKPITTLVTPIGPFYKAEAYHQQYDEKTGRESCPLPGGMTAQ